MKEKENQLNHPLAICRRWFNFLINDVIGRGMKRVTLGSNLAKHNGEEKVPLQPQGRSNDSASEAIEIHFKVNEEEEEENDLVGWSPTDYHKKHAPSDHEGDNSTSGFIKIPISSSEMGPTKGPLTADKAREKDQMGGSVTVLGLSGHGATANGKGPQGAVEPNLGQGRGPKRGVTINESVEGDMARRKGKNLATDASRTQPAEEQGQPEGRRPINVLAQNINERSESFISTRKEAMRRHLSIDLKEGPVLGACLDKRS